MEVAMEVADRLEQVRARIEQACNDAGRASHEVRIIAVSKRHSPEAIRAAYAAGHRDFAENYVQELSAKASELADLSEIRWRFVGHLQRNKAKDVAAVGCAVDTVDSERTAKALAARAQQLGRCLDVMIQVNVAAEQQKSGCAVTQLQALADSVRALHGLDLVGLMTIPPLADDPEHSRPHFRELRQLAEKLSLNEVSMGMSADLEVAVQEGATMVRVGTAIFGPRPERA